MKYFNRILTYAILFMFASCKSEYHLLTHQGNKMDITLNGFSGQWNSQFDRDKVFQEIISYSKDTILLLKPDLFFQTPISINKINKIGQKSGLWITGNYKYFEINNYKNGLLHGKSISYLNTNETIECEYKNGKLDGIYERKLGESAYQRKIYKKGKVTKFVIISPSW